MASVAARALGPGRDPQAGGAGWNRDADQEQWVRAWVWNGTDHAVEMGMARDYSGYSDTKEAGCSASKYAIRLKL